jgi:hypothetical protein
MPVKPLKLRGIEPDITGISGRKLGHEECGEARKSRE